MTVGLDAATVGDRVLGTLIGLRVGDRNGAPVQMAIRVAESLADRGGFGADDILARLLEWWRYEGFDTGPVVTRVFQLIDEGIAPEDAVAQVDFERGGMTAGCNPAQRVAPLAMCAGIPDAALPEAAAVQARLTHAHELAGDAATAMAVLCRRLIRGVEWPDAIATAAADRLPQTRQALDRGCRPDTSATLGPGEFSPEVLEAAVHFVHHAEDFGNVLAPALAFAGPGNYAPVLVGAIAGARWGAASIPAPLLPGDPTFWRLVRVASRLALEWRFNPHEQEDTRA